MLDLVVRGGTVVAPWGVGPWDVAVKDGRIVSVSEPGSLTNDAVRVVDAKGKIVVPGGVEPHAHCSWTVPTLAHEGVSTGSIEDVSRACLFGGTTTLVDFAYWEPGEDLFETLEKKEAIFKGNSHVDYSYHVSLYSTKGELPFSVMEQIGEVIDAGYPSFKVWTTNTTPHRPKQMTDIGHLAEIMGHVGQGGGMMLVHAEDEDIVMFMYKKQAHLGQVHRKYMHHVHNNMSEDISFRRVIRLSEWMECALYLVHVSAKEGVEAIAEARAKGLPVYGETLHHYASFNHKEYERPDGALYHTYPSLKTEADQAALWEGLLDGRLSTLATDELWTNKTHKLRGQTIEDTTGGSEGVESRMGIGYSEGVVKRGMSLERFVDITSANAARLLGLYPKKGALSPGSDADIAIIDPDYNKTLELSDLHGADYSIWVGWEVRGWPVMTILRGEVVVEDGKLFGTKERGLLLPRKIDGRVVASPVC